MGKSTADNNNNTSGVYYKDGFGNEHICRPVD